MLNVLVNGAGNIGTTLTNVLLDFRLLFGIDNIYICKHHPKKWNLPELSLLEQSGAVICTTESDTPYSKLVSIIRNVHYIFDCTASGSGVSNLEMYKSLPNLQGASAQGTERGFGPCFMSGINSDSIHNEKYVRVVSCNSHACGSILSLIGNRKLDNIRFADFVLVRRSEDIGKHDKLVGANIVARHINPLLGTHHAVDLMELYSTIGVNPLITSSNITTPSQLMHAVRFHVELIENIDESEIRTRINENQYVATTEKFDSDSIFELGRRYGFHGRIYSHAIIVENNLLLRDKGLFGWCMVPQEGNTILSTIEAFLIQINHKACEEEFAKVKVKLLRKRW